MSQTRRLIAILAADVAGYSRLMGADEEGTHERLQAHLRELVNPKIAEHRGRIVKNTGDGLLAEFPSVVDAVRCAVEVQRSMADREPGVPEERRIRFRIGINLGDVIVEENDIFGDGVNVAARLEGLAEPGGICVSARVQEDVAGRLDLAFEDMGEQQLKNIARPVRADRVRDSVAPRTQSPPPSPQVLPLPDKPSIAVLPFVNMSGDPEQEYFADGMVEEIITALSRIRWLFVIARNSTFTYKGRAVDVKQVGRELGVRYVLEGSVRKAGQRLRITGQLIDALSGLHLWANHFDGLLADVFDLQDQVAMNVAGVIEPTLELAEVRRAAERPTTDPDAYDLFLRGLPLMSRLSKEDLVEAVSFFEKAIARDPRYAPALALASVCHMRLAVDGLFEDPLSSERKAITFARRAIEAGSSDPVVLANSAFTLAVFGENIAEMLALADRALALHPSYARGWYVGAMLQLMAGQCDLAIEHTEKSLRLSPRDYFGTPSMTIGAAHFLSRRFEAAASQFAFAMRERAGSPWPYRYLAACYGHLGRFDEAREILDRLQAIAAPLVPTRTIFNNQNLRDLLLSGLRLAGVNAI